MINHDKTAITDAGYIIIPSRCGQRVSDKWLAFLSEQDVNNWVLGYDQALIDKYGRRKQCKYC